MAALVKISLTRLWDLHFRDGKSMGQIAKELHCNRKTIRERMRLVCEEIRPQNSVRVCKECGDPVEKRCHARRNRKGERILFGTRCEIHRRAYDAARERKRRRDKDPMVGIRRKGAWKENRKSPGAPVFLAAAGSQSDLKATRFGMTERYSESSGKTTKS